MTRRLYMPPDASFTLISACLATREDPRADAWAIFTEVPEILRHPTVRRAGLMPQLLHAADSSDIELAPSVRSVLRVARVREELRMASVADACRDSLAQAGEEAIVLRGIALAYGSYDAPELRHCHDLDLLVMTGAGSTTHESGFAASAHTSLFASPRSRVSFDEVERDTVAVEICGVRTRVLQPADALVHLCAHAAMDGQPFSPLWCVDAGVFIRKAEVLDWDRVIDRAKAWNVAAATGETLTLLHDRLGVRVPGEALRALSRFGVRLRGLGRPRRRDAARLAGRVKS